MPYRLYAVIRWIRYSLFKIFYLSNWRDFFGKLPSSPLVALFRDGTRLYLSNADVEISILFQIFWQKIYMTLAELREKPAVILDIGGNIGISAVYFAKMAPRARIYVYEPDPFNLGYLNKNIDENNLKSRVSVFPEALSGKSETRTLFVNPSNSSMNNFFDKREGMRGVEVKCRTLSEVLSDHNLQEVDLMKMDVEGAEYEILFATSREVIRKIKKVTLEWHKTGGHNPEELKSYFEKNGFRVRYITKPKILYAERI